MKTHMALGIEPVERLADLDAGRINLYGAPPPPDFPADKAAFVLVSGEPDAETLAALRSIHEVLDKDHEILVAAAAGRERLRLEQEAELKAHPPRPKDLVFNTWTMPAPAAATTPDRQGAGR